jgi:hypothetical protein
VGVRTISREVAEPLNQAARLTPQRLHAELLEASASGARAYLHGAAHDATISRAHRTVRFGQSDVRWLAVIETLLKRLGRRSWTYREGRSREFWIVETSVDVLAKGPQFSTSEERLAYARGYFDAEGGMPRDASARFYVQFVQKNRADIDQLRSMLVLEGIDCGRIHNPSRRVDSDLWRFYVVQHLLTKPLRHWWARGTRGSAVCSKPALGESHEDEDIVHASWRHGDLHEQGSRSGSCGWITSFLGSAFGRPDPAVAPVEIVVETSRSDRRGVHADRA